MNIVIVNRRIYSNFVVIVIIISISIIVIYSTREKMTIVVVLFVSLQSIFPANQTPYMLPYQVHMANVRVQCRQTSGTIQFSFKLVDFHQKQPKILINFHLHVHPIRRIYDFVNRWLMSLMTIICGIGWQETFRLMHLPKN